jgi:hypothetical protein
MSYHLFPNKWKTNGFVARNITIDVHFLSISKEIVPQINGK